MDEFRRDYPWTKTPLVACGPMRLITLAKLAVEVSDAGGLGFIGAGSDASTLGCMCEEVKTLQSKSKSLREVKDVLPVGIGFLLWAGDKLIRDALPLLGKYKPAAIWLFAPNHHDQLVQWTEETRRVTQGKTKVWIQIGTVAEAVKTMRTCQPEVLIVQGTDAGGHGLEKGASLITLFPEVDDAVSVLCRQKGVRRPALVAAGGIIEGRGAAAALALGASGIAMGTRYLATPEANIANGYQHAVLRTSDGGITTDRGKLYDTLRGTTDWPLRYGGRGVLNESYHDAAKGISIDDNKHLYNEALKKGDEGWGEKGRLTTYAGTGVGLVREVKNAAAITEETREDALRFLQRTSGRF